MKRAYLIGGLISLVCLAIAIYYLIPGINHVLTFSGAASARHVKHALVFGALAVLALVGARFAANAEIAG
jgi:hypothetical protein